MDQLLQGVPKAFRYRKRYPALADAASYDASLVLIVARKMAIREKGYIGMSRAGELQGLWERETRTVLENVDSDMEFPFSIFIYEAPLKLGGKARWNEVLRADSQQWAIYVAGLLHNAGVPHQDTIRERPVVKAVRYGLTFLALPSEEAVELVERVIAKQREHPCEPKPPFWAE